MIWFDLDNSPHVPLFNPLIKRLLSKNENVLVTAREFAQTTELIKLYNIPYELIGKHGGKSKIKKIINLLERSYQLITKVKNHKIDLAVSHGSRTQLLAAHSLGIKSILMFDYEYTEHFIFNKYAKYLLCPCFIPDSVLQKANFNLKKIIKYNGFKEELYLREFKPEENFRENIGIQNNSVFIVVRPPSLVGNYHDKKSEKLLIELLNKIKNNNPIEAVVVSRTSYDKNLINYIVKSSINIRFLEKPVDGLQLLYAADMVFSGGGTMNREAALLGTKTFSIFTGKRPYLDEYLQEIDRLKFIENISDLENIEFKKYEKKGILIHNENLIDEIITIFNDLKKRRNYNNANPIS